MFETLLLCVVVGISDGDTLKARCGPEGARQTITVRLAEIDAPEKHQPFGMRSREHLAEVCFQKPAEIRPRTTIATGARLRAWFARARMRAANRCAQGWRGLSPVT